MAVTITTGDQTITPTRVLGYSSTRDSGNLVHRILGRQIPDVTLRPGGLRNGTLRLGFKSATAEADSAAAEALLASGLVFTLTTDERGSVNMIFIANESGRVTRELDDESRDAWIVSVDFQEVDA